MKILYFDLSMGAAGDMLTAALLELIEDKEAFVKRVNAFKLPGVVVEAKSSVKCGVTGTHMHVYINGEEEQSVDAHHEHEHENHSHEHTHDKDCGANHGHTHEIHKHSHEHTHEGHNHEHSHEHVHEHTHEGHNHEHNHEHAHEVHEHAHEHTHEGHSHTHHHASLADVHGIISALDVSDKVKHDACAVYDIIADAEGSVHGKSVSEVHFHEVGTLDAIVDVVSVCMLMEELAPDKVIASAVNTGFGQVRCAHGILPVPAPATALILKGMPVYAGAYRGEMCTPTGAALVKFFADEYGNMPEMTIENIGYGMGTKDFEQANCVRAILGNTFEKSMTKNTGTGAYADRKPEVSCDKDGMVTGTYADRKPEVSCDKDGMGTGAYADRKPEACGDKDDMGDSTYADEISELSCNIDDMSGEALGYAAERLRQCGALDVSFVPIYMKKSRPGNMLTVLCKRNDADRLAACMLEYTSTFGVRRTDCRRYILDRSFYEKDTPYGRVSIKRGEGYGVVKEKPEYEDVLKLATENNMSLTDVIKSIKE